MHASKFYALATAGAFPIAAYLCLVNLDYAALWHDEGPAAVRGKIPLQRGDISGWDGRNLVGHTMLNEDLRPVWPPVMYALNAVGFALFGIGETGARIGIATLYM